MLNSLFTEQDNLNTQDIVNCKLNINLIYWHPSWKIYFNIKLVNSLCLLTVDVSALLFNPLPKRGDLIQQVLKGDDCILDHVYFLHQPFSLRLLQQLEKKGWEEKKMASRAESVYISWTIEVVLSFNCICVLVVV